MDLYRIYGAGIRAQRGAGRTDITASRPLNEATGLFTDTDERPTLCAFDADRDYANEVLPAGAVEDVGGHPVTVFDSHALERLDIPFLLRVGAIAPWTAPVRTTPAKGKAAAQ